MASSMIHLAIIRCIIVKTEFNNLDRLRLGVILPDGAVSGNSHLKKMICEQTRVTYDLEFYREKYGEQMKTDELYLLSITLTHPFQRMLKGCIRIMKIQIGL